MFSLGIPLSSILLVSFIHSCLLIHLLNRRNQLQSITLLLPPSELYLLRFPHEIKQKNQRKKNQASIDALFI